MNTTTIRLSLLHRLAACCWRSNWASDRGSWDLRLVWGSVRAFDRFLRVPSAHWRRRLSK